MKKTIFTLIIFCAAINIMYAQNTFPSTGSAGIGTTTPNASSLLEIKSTTKGLLIPRMTKAQRDAIATPATGLIIYQTNSGPGFYYFNGTAWAAVSTKNNGWSLTGNTGTSPGTNFIGTTDAQPLMFKVNNNKAGYIDADTTKGNNGFGYKALFSNTTGNANTAIGYKALYSNTTGYFNTAIGASTLYSNTTGYFNMAIGQYALGNNTTGGANTATGNQALQNNISGNENAANGLSALASNTAGSGNTAVGTYSLYYTTTGSYNTAIGYFATTTANVTNATSIGYNSSANASNQVRIGNNSITSIGGYVNWTNISDGRVKKNIKQNVPGLAFINKLQPVTYNLDLNAADKILQRSSLKDKNGKIIQTLQQDLTARNEKEKVLYTGFIAQDVEKAAKSLNYDFSGVDAAKNDKDLYGLRYSDFVVPLVKAVQELSKQNDSLQKQINDLKSLITSTNQNHNTAVANLQKQSVQLTNASLEQNTPNPFSGTTTIHYTIPSKFTSAQIIITDRNGKSLKQINIHNTGEGSVNVDASTLSAGAYRYSLYVDGKLIASKQMELIK